MLLFSNRTSRWERQIACSSQRVRQQETHMVALLPQHQHQVTVETNHIPTTQHQLHTLRAAQWPALVDIRRRTCQLLIHWLIHLDHKALEELRPAWATWGLEDHRLFLAQEWQSFQ